MNPAKPDPDRTEKILQTVRYMSQEFMKCHDYLATSTHRLAELLREAESRGVLLHEAFALADVGYWLKHLDWHSKFLGVVLAFAQDPSRATLRPLIELYGRDRDRMKVEVEILERQLRYRLAHFAKPDDALVRKVILKNERRILAVYLNARAGYGGAALARFFKVPRTTAYGWISWFESLPEGLREGVLAFMATQVPVMAACQVPAVMPKADGGSTPVGAVPGQASPHGGDVVAHRGAARGPAIAPLSSPSIAAPYGLGWRYFEPHGRPELLGTCFSGGAFCNTHRHARHSAGFRAPPPESMPR